MLESSFFEHILFEKKIKESSNYESQNEIFKSFFICLSLILNIISAAFQMVRTKPGHWCRRYFTKDSVNGKFICNFCGDDYVEHATRIKKHILVRFSRI
jgi:hypothetical protein